MLTRLRRPYICKRRRRLPLCTLCRWERVRLTHGPRAARRKWGGGGGGGRTLDLQGGGGGGGGDGRTPNAVLLYKGGYDVIHYHLPPPLPLFDNDDWTWNCFGAGEGGGVYLSCHQNVPVRRRRRDQLLMLPESLIELMRLSASDGCQGEAGK